MRIVIEINGDQVTASGVPRSAEAAARPPELPLAAAALDATDAGPAPEQPGPAVPLEQLPPAALQALAAAPIDAGGAPAAPGEDEPATEQPAKPARRSSTRSQSTKDRRAGR